MLIFFSNFSDILQTDVPVDDNAHEFKQILIMLSWIYHNCPSLRYVLKTTSDTYINVVKVMQLGKIFAYYLFNLTLFWIIITIFK